MAELSLQANKNSYETDGITRSDEDLAKELATLDLETTRPAEEVAMGVCARCGGGEVYEGQCCCWLADFDAEAQNELDRAADAAGGWCRVLGGKALIYPVFGAAPKKAKKKDAEDALAACYRRVAEIDEEDREDAGFIAWMVSVTGSDSNSVFNEAFRQRALRAGEDYTTSFETDPVDLSEGQEAHRAAVEVMRSKYAEFKIVYAATNPPVRDGEEGGASGTTAQEPEEEGEEKQACPQEPYENGHCWFYAIDAESREKMWEETECAAFASLREINQLGREYGFSRQRLIIRRVSDGKYHMEPDIGGSSGTARNFQAWMDEIYSPNGIHSRAKTGVFGMPYSNFEGKIRTASLGNWVEVQLLLTTVNACLGRDFSKVTERKAAADDYRKMDRTCPFGHSLQFPHYDQYVWMDGGDWPNKEMQLYSALAFQEASVEDNRGGGGGGDRQRPNQPVSNSFGYNDAATAYYNALRNMKNQVVTMSGVFDRAGLELHFRSFWTADKVIDIVPLVKGVLQPSTLLVDEHAPGSWNWAGLNRYVELDQANNLTTLPASGMVVLWSTHRVAGHRARVVMQRDTHGGSNAISFEVIATAT
jgi:hypothetical protein